MSIRWLVIGLTLLTVVGCSGPYRFQYHYVMIEPPGGSEGVEDDQVRILITPVPKKGLLDLAVLNKHTETIAILWDQTHFIDPFGRRQEAGEAGTSWFFRRQTWFAEDGAIAPGRELRTRVHAGSRQTYNPFSVSRQASGTVNVSTSPRALFPTSGATSSVGEAYQGREFQFVLALRLEVGVTRYPFTFRITDVDVKRTSQR